jgi:hypothetical protein
LIEKPSGDRYTTKAWLSGMSPGGFFSASIGCGEGAGCAAAGAVAANDAMQAADASTAQASRTGAGRRAAPGVRVGFMACFLCNLRAAMSGTLHPRDLTQA